MSYFKLLDLNTPIFFKVEKEFGEKGLVQAIKFLNEAYRQKTVNEIDAEIIANWVGVRIDRAERLLPLFTNLFQEHKNLWRRSSKDKNTSSEDKNTYEEDNTPSNPHGSTHGRAQKTKTETQTNTETETQTTPKSPDGGSECFQEFWEVYPKKTTKQETRSYWHKSKLDDKLPEILNGLNAWKNSEQWIKDDGKYIPDPIRFLKRGRWLDEVKPFTQTARPMGSNIPGNAIVPAEQRKGGSGKL